MDMFKIKIAISKSLKELKKFWRKKSAAKKRIFKITIIIPKKKGSILWKFFSSKQWFMLRKKIDKIYFKYLIFAKITWQVIL